MLPVLLASSVALLGVGAALLVLVLVGVAVPLRRRARRVVPRPGQTDFAWDTWHGEAEPLPPEPPVATLAERPAPAAAPGGPVASFEPMPARPVVLAPPTQAQVQVAPARARKGRASPRAAASPGVAAVAIEAPAAGTPRTLRCPGCKTQFAVSGPRPIVTTCPGCGKRGVLR